MDINAILEMDPNSECKIHFTFTEEWKHCYHQFKQESNSELDPNKLPLLDDEYLNETGEPLYNDNEKEVYDPTQEIEYQLYFEVEQADVYSSKSFIALIQGKIKELINSDELTLDCGEYEFLEALGCSSSADSLAEIFHFLDSKDATQISYVNGYDSLLWCTSSQLDEERISLEIEEIKK